MEKELQTTSKQIKLKTIFILLAFAFISQSIVYLIKGLPILSLDPDFTFFFTPFTRRITFDKIIGSILFVTIFGGLAITYFKILKKRDILFQTKEEMAKFILIVAMIFFVMLPLTSTDVFYYMGTGWSEAKYGVNPYYTSVGDVIQENKEELIKNPDAMLYRTPRIWIGTTIVYGPVWPFICKILSGLSGGNVALALFIYKLFNLVIYLASCYLIYKITKKKKLCTLMYALNPLVLFDGLANVHNDILVVFLILLAFYFFLQKKKMLPTILCLAIATGVKYFAILLVPFLVLYHYRNQKPIKRILYAFGWAIIFIITLIGCYLLYTRDLSVLKGILVQQGKYMNSLFLIIGLQGNMKLAELVSKGCMIAFMVIYITQIIKLIVTNKKMTFSHLMREYSWLLVLFLFGTITNFQSWYCIWILPTIFWQRGATAKKLLGVTIAVELANVVYFVLFEYYVYGQLYYLLMLIFIFAFSKIDVNRKLNIGGKRDEKTIQGE